MNIEYKKEADFSISERNCEICNKNKAQYTCPRCNIPYCNLDCYKNEKHLSCSENFYRDQVITDLKTLSLDSDKEAKGKMVDILKREMENLENEESLSEEEQNLDNVNEQELLKVYRKQVESWRPWWKSDQLKKDLIKEINDAGPSELFKYNPKLIKNSNQLKVSNASEFIYNDMLKLGYSYLILAHVYQLDGELSKDLGLIDEIVFNLMQMDKLIDSSSSKSLDLKSRFNLFVKLLLEKEDLFLKNYISKKFLADLLDELIHIAQNPKLLSYIFSKLYDIFHVYVAKRAEKSENANKENEVQLAESDGELEEEEKPINVFHMSDSKPAKQVLTETGKKSRVQIIHKKTFETAKNDSAEPRISAPKTESPSKKDSKLYLKKLEFYFKWFVTNESYIRNSSNVQSVVNELSLVRNRLASEIKEFEEQKEYFDKNLNLIRQNQIKSDKVKIEEL